MNDERTDEQVEAQKRVEFAERDLVRGFMEQPAGRLFVMDRINRAVLSSSYVPADPLATAFNEGRRSDALEMLSMIDRHAPELLILARREELDRAQKAMENRKTQEQTNG